MAKRRTPKKPSKSARVPQVKRKRKNPKLPSIGQLLGGGKSTKKPRKIRRPRRKSKIKSAQKSHAIERAAQRAKAKFRGGIKQADEIIRTEKKYRHALPWHVSIRKKAQSTAGKLSLLRQYGLYNPRAKAPKKSAIEKAWFENRDFIEPGYLFIPRPKSDKAFKVIKDRAEKSDLKVTDKGVFIKTNYQTKSAKIQKNRTTGYEIVTQREYHDGFGKKHKETIHTPLATADEVEDLKEEFEDRFNRVAAQTKGKKNARVRIYIEGKYGSIQSFKPEDFDLMWSILEKYEVMAGGAASQYGFISRIKFGVSTPSTAKNKVPTKHDAAVMATKRSKRQKQPRDDQSHTVYKKFRGQGRWVYHAEFDDLGMAESAAWSMQQKGYKTKIVTANI